MPSKRPAVGPGREGVAPSGASVFWGVHRGPSGGRAWGVTPPCGASSTGTSTEIPECRVAAPSSALLA